MINRATYNAGKPALGFFDLWNDRDNHRWGPPDRPSLTEWTMPKIVDPFKVSVTVRPLYWATREGWCYHHVKPSSWR
jgi:hypothetical protein